MTEQRPTVPAVDASGRQDRKPTRRAVVALLGLALSAVLVSALAGLGAVGAAAITGSATWTAVGAALTAVITAGAISWVRALASRGRPARAGVLARSPVTGCAVLLVSATLFSLSWAVPATPSRAAAGPGPATGWLRRPDGTALAVHVTHAVRATQPPMIIVHGGPGVADMTHDAPAFAPLATDRDVYVYDRIGTGASSRLTDPLGYTLSRSVADLEALRRDIGAPRIVLHGHSWGARIVVAYAQTHPIRVAGLVLSAPADLPLNASVPKPGDPTTRLSPGRRADLYLRLARPRNLFTYALTAADPVVAHHLATDVEMDRRFAAIYARSSPALFCDAHMAGRVGTDGVGYYAHYSPQLHADPADEPVAVNRLADVTAPVLLIKPACDYLPWSSTAGYRRAFPQARLVMIPDAGHVAYLEKPDLYITVVHDFLTGRPLPLPTVDGTAVPPDYRGTR